MIQTYKVKDKEVQVELQDGTYDEVMAREVLVDDYYRMGRLLKEGDKVLDLGGEVGTFTVLAMELGASKVVVLEPLKQHIKVLQRNVAKYGDKVVLKENAITSDNRKVGMRLKLTPVEENGKHYIHTGDTDIYNDNYKNIESLRYIDLEAEFGVFDVVKLDIEGAEMEVIDDMYICVSRMYVTAPRVIVMEFHGVTGANANANGMVIDVILRNMGYTVEKDIVEGTTQGRIVAYKE